MCAARNELPSEEEDKGLYKIDYSRPGLVFIFYNITFNHPDPQIKPEYDLPDRNGAIKDQQRVVDLFEELNFEVEPFVNITAKETRQILKDMGKRDYTEVDCILFLIIFNNAIFNNVVW